MLVFNTGEPAYLNSLKIIVDATVTANMHSAWHVCTDDGSCRRDTCMKVIKWMHGWWSCWLLTYYKAACVLTCVRPFLVEYNVFNDGLSIHKLYTSNDKFDTNDSLEGALKEVIMAYCEVISRHLSGRLRKPTKTIHVRIAGLRPEVLTMSPEYETFGSD
jgi:hypothetical protein